jgi:signal transduction histidine kinase
MAERAAELGGTYVVGARSGGGTSVRMELPVAQGSSRVEVVDA